MQKHFVKVAMGFTFGFLLGVILDSEEKPRQKFIGE